MKVCTTEKYNTRFTNYFTTTKPYTLLIMYLGYWLVKVVVGEAFKIEAIVSPQKLIGYIIELVLHTNKLAVAFITS